MTLPSHITGQETLSRLLADGITEAPADASPLEAVAAGLERASGEMGVLAFKRGYTRWSEGDRDDGTGLARSTR